VWSAGLQQKRTFNEHWNEQVKGERDLLGRKWLRKFSLDAAAELLRITEVVGSALLVLRAADLIRRHLENDPADKGEFLSEGLYYIDEQPLRAFFLIDLDAMVVEITDFRILKSQPDESKKTSSSSSQCTWFDLGLVTHHGLVRSSQRMFISIV
jgi:hypothetical protein